MSEDSAEKLIAKASQDRHSFYPKNRTRTLSQNQKHLLDNVFGRFAIELKQLEQNSGIEKIFHDTDDEIVGQAEYALEIGFGRGEHMLAKFRQNQNLHLIGCELYLNGIASVVREIVAAKIKRIRLYHGDARELMELLPSGSLDYIFLLYPDPWRKKKHWKRRLLNYRIFDQFARLLRPGGEFLFVSDWSDYASWVLCSYAHYRRYYSSRLDLQLTSRSDWLRAPPDWPSTRYEQKALRNSRQPIYLRFIRLDC